jgi:signal transduction histidine kinase
VIPALARQQPIARPHRSPMCAMCHPSISRSWCGQDSVPCWPSRSSALIGSLATPGEFPKSTVELLETFADQSVLAIQNARLFREIEEKGRELAEASRHKSQFLANMSHELRTPLNAILGYAELMLDNIYGEPSEKVRAVLERLQSNGRHLLGLINDVLDLSKIEAGQLTLSLDDYSMSDVAHGVVSVVEPLAAEKRLAFKAEVTPGLPTGHGDGRRLSQVLIKLVGNAIKFTDKGEIAIRASVTNDAFTVAVCDTGPGISAADQAKIFKEFQQADGSSTRKKGGTGLGLSIAKRIIEMHGGRIWVEASGVIVSKRILIEINAFGEAPRIPVAWENSAHRRGFVRSVRRAMLRGVRP